MTIISANRWAQLAGISAGNEMLLSENVINEATKADKNDIELIQSVLNTLLGDNTLVVDGIWGKNSAKAIAVIQDKKGLVVDGIIGPATFSAMASMLDGEGIDSNLVLGTMIKDNVVIGQLGLIDDHSNENELELPVINISVGNEESEKEALAAVQVMIDAAGDNDEKSRFKKFLAALETGLESIKNPKFKGDSGEALMASKDALKTLNVGSVDIIGDTIELGSLPNLRSGLPLGKEVKAIFDYSEHAPRHEEK